MITKWSNDQDASAEPHLKTRAIARHFLATISSSAALCVLCASAFKSAKKQPRFSAGLAFVIVIWFGKNLLSLLFFALGSFVAFLDRVCLAHVFALLGLAVPARAFLMINVRFTIHPDHSIATAGAWVAIGVGATPDLPAAAGVDAALAAGLGDALERLLFLAGEAEAAGVAEAPAAAAAAGEAAGLACFLARCFFAGVAEAAAAADAAGLGLGAAVSSALTMFEAARAATITRGSRLRISAGCFKKVPSLYKPSVPTSNLHFDLTEAQWFNYLHHLTINVYLAQARVGNHPRR